MYGESLSVRVATTHILEVLWRTVDIAIFTHTLSPHDMSNQTPRIDPSEINSTQHSVFRIIAKVIDQPQPNELIIQSPSTNSEMITLSQVKLSQGSNLEIESWYELVCRSVDTGDAGLMVLDSVKCELKDGEDISITGIVALQQLSSKFPDLYWVSGLPSQVRPILFRGSNINNTVKWIIRDFYLCFSAWVCDVSKKSAEGASIPF